MRVLIAGASGGIGKALIQGYLNSDHQVWAVSHRNTPELPEGIAGSLCLDWINQPGQLTDWLTTIAETHGKPDLVISCTGFLHSQEKGPEKQLKDIKPDFFHQNMTLNCYAHILLSQSVDALYTRKDAFRFAVLSAMVGSITDNHLGGWYSYRISKAALNMFIKTLSVEWKRRHPNATAVAIHPGTTDTALSQPFQANIPEGKLYSTEQTAERLMQVFSELTPEQSGELLFWDGSPLPY